MANDLMASPGPHPATQNLLFEIGTEELPANGLEPLAQALYANIGANLDKYRLGFCAADSAFFVTPRRLGVFIAACQSQQASQTMVRKGPKLMHAFTADGNPTPAALGFAKSCGVEFEQLGQEDECLTFSQTSAGRASLELLPEILTQAVLGLPIPRLMHWGSVATGFVRPVRWLCALFGMDIIPLRLFDLDAGRCSYGHRFIAPQAIYFEYADRALYEQKLNNAHVTADFQKRREIIKAQLNQLAEQHQGTAVLDLALLDEVTGLVEWPVAFNIPFEPRFLSLPQEALVAAMQGHQKCFALKDNQGQLQASFITISNIPSKDPLDVIRGNKRVMHARLSDAEFFYQQDLKIPLGDYHTALDKMTFQHQLGSMATKVEALSELCQALAPSLGVDPKLACQAALLAKSDLCTHMVGEFPELQGIMGQRYALHQGLPPDVATALYQQYLPRFAGDQLPTTPLGTCLALADRLLNLVGIFGVNQVPSGTKDPFALRRAALGVIRIVLAQPQNLELCVLLKQATVIWNTLLDKALTTNNRAVYQETWQEVHAFMVERLRNFWLDQAEFAPAREMIDAVLARHSDVLIDAQARLRALLSFQGLDAAPALSSAYKRVHNFLNKERSAAVAVRPALFEHASEHVLFEALERCESLVQPLLDSGNYLGVLHQLTGLKDPIDAFFNDVMVLVDDLMIRDNRLALLARLHNLLGAVADL